MDHVKTAVSRLKLGEPTTHGGLTVFPLTSEFRSKLRYLLLEDGLRKGLVTIREVSEGGSVPELKVENRADRPVLIVDGEELVGAKQNRVANLTMLIPAERTTIIPVSCVEAGRWSYRSAHFDVSDRVQNARGRAEKLESVRHSIRERGSRRSDQGRVWDSIAEESASLGAASPTSEMGAMFERHKDTLDDYVDMMNAAPDQLGAPSSLSEAGATDWISSTDRKPSPRSSPNWCAATPSTCWDGGPGSGTSRLKGKHGAS